MRNLILNGVENPYYQIDKLGNVYNIEGHKLTQFITNSGYYRVKLSRGCKRGMYSVHRLVAMTYIDNPNNLPIVNHIDHNKTNNLVTNLEWCDNSHNQLARYKHNPITGCEKSIDQFDLQGNYITTYPSMVRAELKTGVAKQNISKVCRGLRNHAGNYIWKYGNKSCVETIERQKVSGM